MQPTLISRDVAIFTGEVYLNGHLTVGENARGVVVFSHGSGSSRLSPRNSFVAQILQQNGFATLLFDLLTEQEDQVYTYRFDIDLLTERLIQSTRWVQNQPSTRRLPIGYFGASTGAASALKAAAKLGNEVKAIVSRGGRPDLAMPVLQQVTAPTLLIVGGLDDLVRTMNEKAWKKLRGIRKMEIVPGATHLFSEPGKLATVAQLASDWFERYLK